LPKRFDGYKAKCVCVCERFNMRTISREKNALCMRST